ncbi:MAG: type II secretion system GspH family protein [Candidatus Shapirobacteria bacterium]|nr:type II secretion system GspH family protein [Candidatus Shapirobacteria bacterium]
MKKKFSGFTLVELMIAMSIIAILSVVLSASFSKAQRDGRDRKRIDDLKAVQNAAEEMNLLSGTYPVTSAAYVAGVRWLAAGGQTVLESYPEDPKNDSSYVYSLSNISSTTYCVCALMENPKNEVSGPACDFTNPAGYFCIKNRQ